MLRAGYPLCLAFMSLSFHEIQAWASYTVKGHGDMPLARVCFFRLLSLAKVILFGKFLLGMGMDFNDFSRGKAKIL